MKRVENKIALITGASRGIGAAVSQLLVAEGAQVILTDILDSLGKNLADSLNSEYYHLDVSSEDNFAEVFELVNQKYGRLDILVNNAGTTGLSEDLGPQDPEKMSLSAWHYIHGVNLDGVFLGCKYGIKMMKRHGGSIINISSRSGMVGIPRSVAYASSKAAVRNHTKSVALYCAEEKYKIRCNSIHPGAILTPMWEEMLGQDDITRSTVLASIASAIPLGHMGEALDVAHAVLFLASDESKYITGAEFTIDGGILAGSSASPK